MSVQLFHGIIADSYHIIIHSGNQEVIVTIDKSKAVEVSQILKIPIQDY